VNIKKFKQKLRIKVLSQTLPEKSFIYQTDAQYSCFKRILKFTLKQLLHAVVGSVVWLQPHHPNQPQRRILTDYFNNYNFSKLK